MTREESIKLLTQYIDYDSETPDYYEMEKACKVAIEALEQEPRKGHWVTRPHVFGVAYCSECGFELRIDNTNFCPNCGADMREGEE